jgi:hypothetical protein
LNQSETIQLSSPPDLKPNWKLYALSCGLRLLVLRYILRDTMPGKLPMVQDLLRDLSSSNMDRVIHEVHSSVNDPSWHSACSPLVNGKKHGTRRTPQFGERSISLVPRTAFRCVFSGLWRGCWFSTTTAPSFRRNRRPHTGLSFVVARHTTGFYGGRRQFDEHSRELERERNLRWQCGGRDDHHGWRLHLAG